MKAKQRGMAMGMMPPSSSSMRAEPAPLGQSEALALASEATLAAGRLHAAVEELIPILPTLRQLSLIHI